MRVPAMGESPYPLLTGLSRRTLARQLTGAAFALALLPAAALAAPDLCADQFLDGVQPRLVNLKLVPMFDRRWELCVTARLEVGSAVRSYLDGKPLLRVFRKVATAPSRSWVAMLMVFRSVTRNMARSLSHRAVRGQERSVRQSSPPGSKRSAPHRACRSATRLVTIATRS